jgi:hypothetical protein
MLDQSTKFLSVGWLTEIVLEIEVVDSTESPTPVPLMGAPTMVQLSMIPVALASTWMPQLVPPVKKELRTVPGVAPIATPAFPFCQQAWTKIPSTTLLSAGGLADRWMALPAS